MSDLDEHVWADIMKRLPAKVIGRIRCVCKSWNSLISSSLFVSKHLSFLGNNHPPRHICYLLFDVSFMWSNVILYSFYSPHRYVAPRFSPFPFNNVYDDDEEVMYTHFGVIHGVVCLSREADWSRKVGSDVLWNPTLQKHVALPHAAGVGWVVVGFGFSARGGDFKVVRCLRRDEPLPPRFEVFSTRRGCWRSVASDPVLGGRPFFILTYCHCFMNGSIHWVIRGPDGVATLLVFDCEKEEFRTMQLPQQVRRRRIYKLFIEGGMLSFSTLGKPRQEAVPWVMHEYGVSASWKKLTTWPRRHFVTIDNYGLLFHETDQMVREPNYHKIPHYYMINGSQQPLNGHVFQPSLFLMDDANALDTLKV